LVTETFRSLVSQLYWNSK